MNYDGNGETCNLLIYGNRLFKYVLIWLDLLILLFIHPEVFVR